MGSPELTGYEPGLVFLGCDWTYWKQDACPYCAGELCGLCRSSVAGGTGCSHDSLARHYAKPPSWRHYKEN